MQKTMLIGKTGSGKTTLIQAVKKNKIRYNKTQTMDYYPDFIDTPGEYIENRSYYNAIISSVDQCHKIAFVQDAADKDNIFPPNFASTFNQIVFGIITKIDKENADLVCAEEILRKAGVNKIFKVSSISGKGLKKLKQYLKNKLKNNHDN
ncbi:MAG: EutP/PduV family microcompartment system protein [bacterium]